MVMTILEAYVSEENWSALEQAYRLAAQQRDPGLVQSFLIHSSKDLDLWRILTVWSSREALDKMRSSGETPRGVLIFRSANAEPILSVFEVVQQIIPVDGG
jgi:heme-degrading monooxygenase HmoA